MLSRRALLPTGFAMLAAALCGTHGEAQAAGISGLGTPIGLGGAWLALLAAQSAAGLLAPAQTLVAAALAVLGVAAFTQWGPGRRRAGVSKIAAPDGHEALLATARLQFMQLQAAWDRGDEAALRALTTADMLQELLTQLPARGSGPNRTDVLSLEARLLAVDRIGPLELASIEFSGMICESPECGAVPFRELWMLARPASAAGAWRLARHQALM